MAIRKLLGVFPNAENVATAMDSLRDKGFHPEDLDIYSGSPYPEGSFGEHTPAHRLYVFPFIGALCGFSVALLITAGTQLTFPLVTGGKPILSIPPMTIITYEGTMLGALIFTVFGILFESRLGKFSNAPYDPRITEGYIGVVVTCPDERAKQAEDAMLAAGAEVVRRDTRA